MLLDLSAETIVMYMRHEQWCWDFIIQYFRKITCCWDIYVWWFFRCEFYENHIYACFDKM